MNIKRCRLTFVWLEAIPELLQNSADGSISEHLSAEGFANTFNKLLKGTDCPPFDLPWPHKQQESYSRNFWNSSLFKSFRDRPNADHGKLAWKAAIPLRHKTPLARIASNDRCFVEGWYFPLGVAVSVTAWLSGSYDENQFDAAMRAFQSAPQTLNWADGTVSSESLRSLSRKALDQLRSERFNLPPNKFEPESFKIVTIIAGEITGSDKPAEQESMLNSLLAAAGRGMNAVSPPGDVFVLSENRLIWRPDAFLNTSTNIHTLGCLHRNVTMATLHVATLIRSAEIIVTEFIENGSQVPVSIEPYARLVAGLLGRIYGNDRHTYKLPASKDQIARARPVINALRDRLDMEMLQ